MNPPETLDLTATHCPMTFVRLKVALEEVETGDQLDALLNTEEHPREIPPSVLADGHEIVSLEREGRGLRMRIRKGGGDVPTPR